MIKLHLMLVRFLHTCTCFWSRFFVCVWVTHFIGVAFSCSFLRGPVTSLLYLIHCSTIVHFLLPVFHLKRRFERSLVDNFLNDAVEQPGVSSFFHSMVATLY